MSTRYAAFLRGVSPMNCKMADLKACLEGCGFTDVRTLLSSGNAVFTTRATSEAALITKLNRAFAKDLDTSFMVFIRPVTMLQELLASDPYGAWRLPSGAKRVVTFLADKPAKSLVLPIDFHNARIHGVQGLTAFSSYVPGPYGPAFMTLIEKTFGKAVTTRTWDTVRKVAVA